MSNEIDCARVDQLIGMLRFNKAYEFAKQNWNHFENPEMGWRVAQLAVMNKVKPNIGKMKTLMTEGLEIVTKALEMKPNSPQCLTWYGLLLSMSTNMIGIQEMVRNAKKIKESLTKSERLDPNYYLTHHALGLWHFTLSKLNQRQPELISKYGINPRDFSYKSALDYFYRCEKMASDKMPINAIYLAKCYAQLDERHKAKEICNKILKIPYSFVEVNEAKEDAEDLLQSLS